MHSEKHPARISFLIAYGISLILLTLMAAELFCRWQGICQLKHFKTNDWPNPEIFVPSNVLPFELAPNIPNFSNALGMRDKEYQVKKADGVFRCVVLGDSITMYGHYTDYLEEKLKKRYHAAIEVWNCSIGGQGIKDYYYHLLNRCLNYDPDLLMIGFCLNDFSFTPILYKTKDGKLLNYRAAQLFKGNFDNWLFLHSNAYRFAVTSLESKYQVKGYLLGKTYLKRIKDIAAARAIPLFVVLFPFFTENSENEEEYATMRQVIGELGIPCIDLHEVFPKNERGKYIDSPADIIHPNEQAHRLVADVIERYMTEKRMIPLREQ